MPYELVDLDEPLVDELSAMTDAPQTRRRGNLPDGLVYPEAAVDALRAFLNARGRGAWQIFKTDLNVDQIVRHAASAHGTASPQWQRLPALSNDREAMQLLNDRVGGTLDHTAVGVVMLDAFDVAVARWLTIELKYGSVTPFHLIAAPSVHAVERLQAHVRAQEAAAASAVWQILRGGYAEVHDRPPRTPIDRDSIVIDDALAARLDREVIGFFTQPVAAMYRALRVPHRRGVLLFGPPGNGKTSTIRYLGGRLPNVAALILRPNANFDGDDLVDALKQWTAQAPAMLVIEDLNWLLGRVDVSVFLNALDGIDTPDAKGLLLIASTNHPDKLDPALSNRPGRFDVVVEMPLPCDVLRRRYLALQMPALDVELAERLVRESDGLSFAHLGEVLRMSGLRAIAEGRDARSADDLLAAVDVVRAANDNAERGFVGTPPPFGLQTLVRRE